MVVADLSWQADTANEQVTGQAPSGELEITAYQWNAYAYPLNGSATQMTTAASPYSVTWADFDVRDSGRLRVRHFDPASGFATQVDADLRFFELDLPNGVGARQLSASDVLTATLYESDGLTLKYETSQDDDDGSYWYWLDPQGMIEPGDWLTVTDGADWTASMQAPYLDVQAHEDDYIWGSGPTALLWVEYEQEQDDWAGYFVPANDAWNNYVLDAAFYGHGVQWGHRAGVIYQASSGNRARSQFDWPQIVAHYDENGWSDVWGDYAFPGVYVYLTVTHPLSGVIATAGVLPGACSWCAPDHYNSQDLLPSDVIVPGNTIKAKFDDGYVSSMTVLDISAEANSDTDVVTVTAPLSTPVSVYAYNASDWWDSEVQIVGAGGYVTFDLGAEGYDVTPNTGFDVYGYQEHGHRTSYSFRLPAPDLRVGKWHSGNYARPGGVQVYSMYYVNEGDEVAENALIVDTLPSSLTYAADTSGVTPDVSAGGVLTWDLGTLDPGEDGAFMLTLDVPADMPTGSEVITSNCAAISSSTPESDWSDNEACVDPVDVWDDDVELAVDKWVFPDDPTPGQELIYTVQWCNNRGAAAGPAWLTDTLPLNTSLVSWDLDQWRRRLWVEVSATDEQLVLYAPGLPGDTCQELYVTLRVDAAAPISATLENEVVIAVADDVYGDNNYSYNADAHVSSPRYDLRVEKYFESGVLAPGGWINYYVYYDNNGNIATNVSLQDVLPAGLGYAFAYWGGDQPDAGASLPAPIIVGNSLTWNLGQLPVGGSRWFYIQANIGGAMPPGSTIVNCVTVDTSDGPEDAPVDNNFCQTDLVNASGPNLRVSKYHQWDGDGQLDYDIRFENIGDEIVSDVWITDYLPAGTAWNGWWDIDSGWDERLFTYTESSSELAWNLSELYPGDVGGVHFEADLDEPGLLMQWYTNTVEISTPPGDPSSWDNVYYDGAFSGLAQLVVWIDDPDGNPANGHVVVWDEWGNFVASRGARPDTPAMFDGLQVGAKYWVQAWPPFSERPAWANSVKKLVTIGAGLSEFGLALQHPNITGVIRTPEGDPLPAVYDGEGDPTYPAALYIHNEDWSVDIHVATNPDGEFGAAMPQDDYVIRGEPAQELVFTYTQSLPQEITVGNTPQDLGEVWLTYPRVWGWVLDPLGNPVSTWVNVWREDGEYWDGDDTFAPWEGAEPFRLGGLPPGLYNVQAESPWYNPEGYGSSRIVTFTVEADSWYDPASTELMTLTLRPANFVGDVLFPPGSDCPGCPAQWADVRLRDADWNWELWRNTGEDGRVAFSGLEAGDYVVDVFLPDYLAVEWDPPAQEQFSLASSNDQVQRALYLQAASLNKHVVGQVLYDDGTPVGDADSDGQGDAWVYAHHWESGGWTGAASEPDGSYQVDLKGGLWTLGVDPMHPDVDWYFDAGEQWVWFPYTPTLELFKTVTFTVTRAVFFNVTGRMEDGYGNAPPEGTAGLELCSDEGRCFGAEVESDGSFNVAALPGFYRAWVWVDPSTGLFPPLYNGFPVFVQDDVDLGTLRLRSLAERTATVSGRVIITPTGQGAVGIEVEAWTDEGDWASTTTITDGNYVLNMFPGRWHGGPVLTPRQEENLVVLPPRYQHGRLKANQTISNVNFYVRYRDAAIQGRLVDQDGAFITDPGLSAVVYAEFCPANQNLPCWIVDEEEAQGGAFELRVIGGVSYTLGVWVQSPGYLAGPAQDVSVGIGETKTGLRLTLVEAGTRIFGGLRDGETGAEVQVEAVIYGGDSNGLYWVEDNVWPGKEPYLYELYVPTPETTSVTWTLGLWLDTSTGYVADPASPYYEVEVEPGREQVWQPLKVTKLDTLISGTVWLDSVGGVPAPYVWVFAEGADGLYFETETDRYGNFAMYVLPGQYDVGVHLPPYLADNYFPPPLQGWSSVDDNPLNLVFRSRAGLEVEISGGLDVVPPGSVGADAGLFIFGWNDDGVFSIATGTLASGYSLPVISNTTWYVWAAYEDLDNNTFYYTLQPKDVIVGGSDVTGVNLTLLKADFELPDTECWSFDASSPKRLSLPAWGDLPEPLVEIQAGTFSVNGEVEVCVTPMIAVPDGQALVGFAYDIEARDEQGNLIVQDLNKSVRLIFYYDEAELPVGVNPEDLIPSFYSTSRQEWTPLENVYLDPEDGFVTGKIKHFSKMGVVSIPGEQGYSVYLPLLLNLE